MFEGTDRASATEIPPLKPPHVKIGIIFLSKDLLSLKNKVGM